MGAPAAKVQPFQTAVETVVDETPTVRTLRFRIPAGRSFDFFAGQHLVVRRPGSPKVERTYSISSSPLDKAGIEITLGSGDPAGRMFELSKGEPVEIHGPYGDFHYLATMREAVLVAAGTGIAPFRSMWRSVLDRGLSKRLTVLYSVKNLSEVVFAQELKDIAGRPGIKVVMTVTRPETLGPGQIWRGPIGRITLEGVRREADLLDRPEVFLCGPQDMVSGLAEGLAEAGVAPERIHHELW